MAADAVDVEGAQPHAAFEQPLVQRLGRFQVLLRLRPAGRERRELLADVLHELRQPRPYGFDADQVLDVGVFARAVQMGEPGDQRGRGVPAALDLVLPLQQIGLLARQ